MGMSPAPGRTLNFLPSWSSGPQRRRPRNSAPLAGLPGVSARPAGCLLAGHGGALAEGHGHAVEGGLTRGLRAVAVAEQDVNGAPAQLVVGDREGGELRLEP